MHSTIHNETPVKNITHCEAHTNSGYYDNNHVVLTESLEKSLHALSLCHSTSQIYLTTWQYRTT